MAQAESFQVDEILNSLQDLKQVRERNERLLAQLYAKRTQLETKLELVNSRHAEASAKKTQSLEALKVVTEQACLAESQASRLEQVCSEKREEVREMNAKIEEQTRLKEEALSEFTVRMTKLIDKFRSARSYYTEPHLRSEVERCTTDIQEARQRVSAKKDKVSQLKSELFQLQQQRQLEREKSGEDMDHSTGEVTRETWQTLLDMMTEEKSAARAALVKEEEDLRSLQQQKQEIWSEMTELAEQRRDRESGGRVTLTGREE